MGKRLYRKNIYIDMKKRLFAVLVGMLLCCNIFAQKEPGTLTLYPRVGLNLSKFSGDKIYRESFDYVKSKFKSGLVIGAEMQYQMSFPLAISGGVMFSQQGTSFGEIDGFDDLEISANNINVPLMLVATTKYGISAKIGIQPEFRVSNKHDAILNKVNCSIPIGLSYEYHNIAFDIRYNLGLTHVYKNMTDNAHNSTLMFTLGYGIDL